MTQYAYVRVSTREQNIDRQIAALEPYALKPKNIYIDHQSGKDFERPAWRRLIRRLRRGDVLLVKSIDRLGRNYSDIIEQWQHITKTIGADIVVLDMSLLDTRNRDDNLTGTLIADLVLQILAYVAQSEREFIRQRQAEGIAAARRKGVRFGRKPLELAADFEDCCAACGSGRMTQRQAAAILGISQPTFFRRYHEYLDNRRDVTTDSKGRLYESPAKAQNRENIARLCVFFVISLL